MIVLRPLISFSLPKSFCEGAANEVSGVIARSDIFATPDVSSRTQTDRLTYFTLAMDTL